MKEKFFSVLQNQYPELPDNSVDLISENLISPFHIKLPSYLLKQAQNIVKHLYLLRENKDYQSKVLENSPASAKFDPKNKSICMSYDFHIDQSHNLKLIEVNTNAAFLLLGLHLYEAKKIPLPVIDFSTDEIIDNIKEECSLSGINNLKKIIITDSHPEEQRLYIEFLAFQLLFKKYGYDSEIMDIGKLSNPPDFIYNRSTDFYFEDPTSEQLKAWYDKNLCTVSPNPHEYALLADKERLNDWNKNLDNYGLKVIEPNLLKSFAVDRLISPELWAIRKKFFFKPMQSFGSKMSFRGESISKKTLEQLVQDEQMLAQEYCPPPSSIFKINDEDFELKYDLRFYAYKDRIQLVVARLYQGQVTNLKARHGGFACVEFTD